MKKTSYQMQKSQGDVTAPSRAVNQLKQNQKPSRLKDSFTSSNGIKYF